MAFTAIGVGASANDGTGDDLRTAFQTVNSNFTALDAAGFGGLRNRIINGDFSIHQRGGSQTGVNFIDRWYRTAVGGVNHTFTQQTFTAGQTDVTGNPEHYLRWAMDAVPSSAAIQHNIEGVRTLEGREITYSFWAKASEALTLQGLVQQYWGGGSPIAAFADTNNFSLTTSWQRFTRTLTLPSLSGKTIAAANYLALRLVVLTSSAAPTIELADVQLEPGGLVTPFERRPRGLELALCQRYYAQKVLRTENGSRHAPLPPMRAAPTVTVSAGSAANITKDGFELTHNAAADCTVTALAEL